jgi:phospholipid/cholesterol/gamma-HCH transport system permease protein
VGLVVKGGAFGFCAGLFACQEGLRRPPGADPRSLPAAACRAACLAVVAILAINSGWFLLVYHAGPAFGPTLLAPPALRA